MSNQPPDKKTPPTQFIHHERSEDFDVFRTDGNSSTLTGQHFAENSIGPRNALDHQFTHHDDLLSITGTTIEALTRPLSLKERIAQAKIAQEEALKQMHAVHDAAGPVIHHHLIDAQGPTQERQITDIFAYAPTHNVPPIVQQDSNIEERSYNSGSGPILEPTNIAKLDLLERIHQVKAAQQEALNQFHAMHDLAGPTDQRAMEDGLGPHQTRQWNDTHASFVAPPKFVHDQLDTRVEENYLRTGPIISHDAMIDALAEKLDKARTAEQEALHQIKAMQDAHGPVQSHATLAVEGPLITAPTVARQGPIQAPDIHFNQQVEVHASDRSPIDGPIINDPSHHLNVQIIKAHSAQEQALGYLHAIHDAEGPIDTASSVRAMGTTDPRLMADAQGDINARTMVDAQGAIDPRSMQDAVGPVVPRSLFDNALSSFSRAFFHKEPASPNTQESSSAKAKESPANKTTIPVAIDDSLNLQARTNNMAERMAKVRSDQLKTMNDLDSLEKNTVEQIKRMEEKK
jgi:hypothetical protein